ncbi:MAG: right-handed parallel beta-helix repeat-containing protein, partial [Candidatus Aenigmatarchaeota archaeon]
SSQANLSCASPYNFSASKEGLFNSTVEDTNQSKIVEISLSGIIRCQNITASGYYQLVNDVSSIGTCFNITASNVELDCNWKRINYAQSTSGYGVYVDQKNNVTVKNCRMNGGSYDYSYGIYFYYSNFSTAQSVNITTRGSFGNGVEIFLSKNNTILSSNITTIDGDGISIENSNNNTISANNITTSGDSRYGIYIYSSSNNNVSQNNFYTYNGYAVFVSGTNQYDYNNYIDQTNTEYGKPILYYFNKTNLVIENNDTIGEIFIAYSNYTRIKNVTLDKDGVVFAYTRFSNITEAKIKTMNYGIYLSSSNNNTILSNNITTSWSFGYGVYLHSSSNNTILSNNITTSGISGYGIYLYIGGNNTILSNNITTSDYSIRFFSARDNIISSNNITTSGDYSRGVYLYSSSNNTILSNNITTSGDSSRGVYLYSSSNNNFINNFIKTNNLNAHAFYIYTNSFNLTLINNTINTTAAHIRFRENSSMQIINTSFNKSKVFWESTALNAWINVSYYVDVYVRNFTDPINAAQVNITNYTNSLVHSSYTGSNGYIQTQLLPEFFANGSYVYSCPSSQANLSCASPYNFSASKENIFNSTIDQINQSKIVEIILFQKILSVSLSEKLSQGIFFTSVNGSLNNTQLPVEIEKWNNATWNYNKTPSPGDNKTTYWIYNSGNVNQDFCLKANEDLTCYDGPCTTMTISASNVAFTNSTFNNVTHPLFSSDRNLSTSYVKIAENVMPGEYHYFRFWLYVERDKPSGIYNTTFSVRNVESGSPCQ